MNEFNMDNVISFHALYESMCKCRKGTMWKASVASYSLNALERTLKLKDELVSGSYVAKEPVHFTIRRPKPRDIASIAFRDRVYQRSLNDNAVYEYMSKPFIYDNYACQHGKGTDKARNRLKEFMRRTYRRYGMDAYILQVDIKGYYPNMRHDICESVFKKHLPPEVFNKVVSILRNQYPGEVGYNPGSQLVQIAGISVLNELDHRIKEQLHIECYLRYMDDFILIHHSKAYLEQCLQYIVTYLNSIGFDVNPSKTAIFNLEDGVEFLGFRYRPTTTGKILMLLTGASVKCFRQHALAVRRCVIAGTSAIKAFQETVASWVHHASKGNSFRCIRRTLHLLNVDGVTL